MKLVFEEQSFSYQLLRTIGHGIWVFGATTPAKLVQTIRAYTLNGYLDGSSKLCSPKYRN